MANALKDLFTNIATSIRKGLPDAGAMSPRSFPEKIDEIVESMGSGSGGGLIKGLTCSEASLSFTKSMAFATTIKGKALVSLPEDAAIESLYVSMRCKALGEDGTTKGSSSKFTRRLNPSDDLVVYDTYGGKITYELLDFEYTNTSAYMITASDYVIKIRYTMPDVYIENNILYSGNSCKGLFAPMSYTISDDVFNPMYLEAIDLRGSQITYLYNYALMGHEETKKIWLPEGLVSLESEGLEGCMQYLEELHFTSTMPPTFGTDALKKLNATCKIYVPVGTLESYTSQRYAPSPSTYTYIEE